MKYFLTADLHGIHPMTLMLALKDAKFENENKNHKLVVCGDFIDGFGYDDKLIDLLRIIEMQEQLIIVKGNHEIEPFIKLVKLSPQNYKWLQNIHTKYVDDNIIVAHGIYTEEDFGEMFTTWISPVMLGRDLNDWRGSISHDTYEKVSKIYPNLDTYLEKYKDKLIIVGHEHGYNSVKWFNDLGIHNYELDSTLGYVKYKNLIFVGGDIYKDRNVKIFTYHTC